MGLLEKAEKLRGKKKEEPSETKVSDKPKKEIKEEIIKKPAIKVEAGMIETDLDKLLDIVKKRKVIKVSTAASLLGVSKEKVTHWAKVLEDSGLIKTHFPPIGELELMSIEKK